MFVLDAKRALISRRGYQLNRAAMRIAQRKGNCKPVAITASGERDDMLARSLIDVNSSNGEVSSAIGS